MPLKGRWEKCYTLELSALFIKDVAVYMCVTHTRVYSKIFECDVIVRGKHTNVTWCDLLTAQQHHVIHCRLLSYQFHVQHNQHWPITILTGRSLRPRPSSQCFYAYTFIRPVAKIEGKLRRLATVHARYRRTDDRQTEQCW